jgi:PIN domain nuclease of toxin-antitoxin system
LRILLDTNIAIMLLEGGGRLDAACRRLLASAEHLLSISTASLWEMGIKHRSGKLELHGPLATVEARLGKYAIAILPIDPPHVLRDPQLPATVTDPFDRLITAVAELEDMTLLTTDRALQDHPLAWRP